MDAMEAENLLKKLDRRLQNVEQILPTLPTRDEMHAAIAEAVRPLPTRDERHAAIAEAVGPLPTRDEMHAAVAEAVGPLATRAEMREEGERTRRHFDVVAESLREDIRLIAEGQLALQAEVRQGRTELNGRLKNHEVRITRLEASQARKTGKKR